MSPTSIEAASPTGGETPAPDLELERELEPLRAEWAVRAGVTFLNHGSFGLCPRPVLEASTAWSRRLAAEPCEFLQRQSSTEIARVRDVLGDFLGCAGGDLIPVPNATTGCNIAAHHLARRLTPGDEVLVTDHEYGAMLRMWGMLCERHALRMVTATLPARITDPQQIEEAVFAEAGPRTRVLMFSHVTSPTALVLPARRLIARARAAGIVTLVDGAHAPGMRPLELSALGADWYAGNCHKWLCAPLGAGFLYKRPDVPAADPLVISWGERVGCGPEPIWQAEHEWAGSRDPAAFLAVADAVAFHRRIGWDRFLRHTRTLVRYARHRITTVTGIPADWADDDRLIGSMVSLPMPPGEKAALQDALFHRFGIEAPVVIHKGVRRLRVSVHAYTTHRDIDRLAEALPAVL